MKDITIYKDVASRRRTLKEEHSVRLAARQRQDDKTRRSRLMILAGVLVLLVLVSLKMCSTGEKVEEAPKPNQEEVLKSELEKNSERNLKEQEQFEAD